MSEAYIVAAVRTAGGRRGGRLAGWHPVDLAAQVLNELVDRSGPLIAGLDEARARAVLQSNEYAAAVREREAFYQGQGIHSVPAVIINDRHLIQGGQPAEVFEQALRQIAAQQA